jgi:hypothetical protein
MVKYNMPVEMQTAVSITYRLDSQGSIPGRAQKMFLFLTAYRLALGPLIQWVLGVLSLFHTSLLMTRHL